MKVFTEVTKKRRRTVYTIFTTHSYNGEFLGKIFRAETSSEQQVSRYKQEIIDNFQRRGFMCGDGDDGKFPVKELYVD